MLGWIVFTVVIAGLIGAPFLYWRSVRRRVQAAEASVLGISREPSPLWNPNFSSPYGARGEAKAGGNPYVGEALPGLRLVYPYGGTMSDTQMPKHRVLFDGEPDPSDLAGRQQFRP